MHLTEIDQQYLDRLKKKEAFSYKYRYLNLILGITCLLLAFVTFFFLLFFRDSNAFEEFSTQPVFYLLSIAGGVGIGWAIRGWQGNPTSRLLIKIVEELANEKK